MDILKIQISKKPRTEVAVIVPSRKIKRLCTDGRILNQDFDKVAVQIDGESFLRLLFPKNNVDGEELKKEDQKKQSESIKKKENLFYNLKESSRGCLSIQD